MQGQSHKDVLQRAGMLCYACTYYNSVHTHLIHWHQPLSQ